MRGLNLSRECVEWEGGEALDEWWGGGGQALGSTRRKEMVNFIQQVKLECGDGDECEFVFLYYFCLFSVGGMGERCAVGRSHGEKL